MNKYIGKICVHPYHGDFCPCVKELRDSFMDVLNHGMQYENGEIHQADLERAKKIIEVFKGLT